MDTQAIIRFIADGAAVPIVLLAGFSLLFYIPKGQRFEAYKRIVLVGMTTYLLAKLLGSVYQPAEMRPFEMLGVSAGALYLNNPGFPSDHALFTTFLTLAVWFEARRKDIAIVLAVLTLLVCVGRVLALVHTPLDVVGGVFVACLGALWYVQGKEIAPIRKKHKKAV